jgi:1D-myo-inositol 3-kinase
MHMTNTPDFVAVGYVCQDVVSGGYTLGGTASYSAITAHRLGQQVGAVTSVGPDLDLAIALPGVQVANHAAPATTTFENIYSYDGRRQFIRALARHIRCADVPETWRAAPVVHLGPLAQEMDDRIVHCFADHSLVGVGPQGWLRQWDDAGHVTYTPWTPSPDVLRRVDVLVLSELDLPDPEKVVREWGGLIKHIIITRAERGATVYSQGDACHYPARPARQVDPTGAGDVFGAAFLIRLHETGDPCAAAQFANVVASFSIEGPGVAGIPRRATVDAWMREHPPSDTPA